MSSEIINIHADQIVSRNGKLNIESLKEIVLREPNPVSEFVRIGDLQLLSGDLKDAHYLYCQALEAVDGRYEGKTNIQQRIFGLEIVFGNYGKAREILAASGLDQGINISNLDDLKKQTKKAIEAGDPKRASTLSMVYLAKKDQPETEAKLILADALMSPSPKDNSSSIPEFVASLQIIERVLANKTGTHDLALAWALRGKLNEIILSHKNKEEIRKTKPFLISSPKKTIIYYRHSLELDPMNREIQKSYQRVAGKTFEETVLSRLYDSEYEPAAYLPVSPRLKEPLKQSLNEGQEIEFYWSKQAKDYKQFLVTMNAQIGKPIDPDCRISIGIPSYLEAKNIFRTLETFVSQKNIDPSEFEVIVFENHPISKKRDDTKEEVERFKKTYPKFRIYHIYHCFPEIAPMGMVRKIIADLGLKRRMESKKSEVDKDFIIATSDADSYGMKERSLRFIIDAFDKDPGIASITGKLDYPKEALIQFPTLHALIRFNAISRLINEKGYFPRDSSGASSHLRASVYASIGGFDYKARRGEDAERGGRLNYYGKGRSPFKMLYTNSARFFTDPRRAIDTMNKGKSWREQWQDINWQKNQDNVLGTSWKDFTHPDLTTFSKSTLEDEINFSAHHKNTLKLLKTNPDSKETQKRLNALKRTMDFMGIKYAFDLEKERIVLTDTSLLEKKLQEFRERYGESKVKTYNLTKGRNITLEYDQKKPLLIMLPDGSVLRIVAQRELASLQKVAFPKDYFVIVNLKLFKETNGQKGYKGLADKEIVELGRATKPLRFDFGPEINPSHLRIERRGNTISITDLNSPNGTKVKF